MDRIRSYKSLMYLCARKWKLIVASALVVAVVFGMAQGSSLYHIVKNGNSGDEWEKKLEDYTLLKNGYEGAIAKDEAVIEREQKYIDGSVLLKCRYTCVIDLAIKLDLSSVILTDNTLESDSMSYMSKAILCQYMACFRNYKISEIPFLYSIHYRLKDEFWEEIVSVEEKENVLIEITCLGETEEDARAIADMLQFFFTSRQNSIAETSYPHTLEMISYVTKNEVDASRYEVAALRVEAKNEAEKSLLTHQSMLESLVDPNLLVEKTPFSTIFMRVFLTMIGGLLVGAFLMGMFLVIKTISKHTVLTAREIEENCHLIHLGSLANRDPQSRNWNEKWNMEHIPKSEDEANRYIVSSICNRLESGSIVFTSTMENIERFEEYYLPIINRLKEKGFTASFIKNPKTNADFVENLGKVDKVILVERGEISSMKQIDEVKEICHHQNTKEIDYIFLCW